MLPLKGFERERGSINLAAVSRDYPEVSWDPVATLHLHQIPDHHFLGIDAFLLSVADHQSLLQDHTF